MGAFSRKVVIVTGGAKGIGAGICRGFTEAGAIVICADIDEIAGEEISSICSNSEGQLNFHPCDVSLSEDCKKLVEAATKFGRLDVLSNNAGIQPTDSYLAAHELPETMWDQIIDVNLKSTFLMSKYAIPHMKRQGGGVIINTASVQGLQSARGVSAYAASKGGQLSLTRQLALEYAEDNICFLQLTQAPSIPHWCRKLWITLEVMRLRCAKIWLLLTRWAELVNQKVLPTSFCSWQAIRHLS